MVSYGLVARLKAQSSRISETEQFLKSALPLVQAEPATPVWFALRFGRGEYGNYLNTWRQRNALKMWTGWPTFPMVFVKGTLVGGYSDLRALIASGELKKMLARKK